ncbi:MAG TPA: amidohydrolase family protein [Planctomycetota bacterium]|nr:amidohydrolase family protein [Planctomycetota bacterium]
MNRIAALSFLLLAFSGGAPGVAQDGARPLYRTSYRVVDIHHHCDGPDADAMRARMELLDRSGVCAVANLDAGRVEGTLPAWIELQKTYPGRIVLFPKFTRKDFEGIKEPGFFDGLVRELRRAAERGARGVKIWKDLGMFIRDESGKLLRIDDPRLDPFWTTCGDLGLVVFMHSADPREYWYPLTLNSLHYGARTEEDQYYKIPGMPRWEDLIAQRDAVLAKHPKTTFIGAHFASMTLDLSGLAERLDRYPNLHVECGARLRMLGRLNPKAVRDFFTKYQDRILFGTDIGGLLAGRKSKTRNFLEYGIDDPDWNRIDPKDVDAVRRWQDRQALSYSRYFEYFETDRIDLIEPGGFGAEWMRLAGVKLPPDILEKLYHANAERLIPDFAKAPARK